MAHKNPHTDPVTGHKNPHVAVASAPKSKKAVAEKKPEPAKILSPDLFDEIDGLVKASTKLIDREEDGTFEIQAYKIPRAVDVLSLVRALAARADVVAKAELATILKPVEDKTKQLAAEKKSIVGRAGEIESDVVKALQALILTGHLTAEGAESPNGCKLSLIGKDAVKIYDPSIIPDEFLLPRAACIDVAKVTAMLLAEKAYADALPEGTEAPPSKIEGAHLTKVYTFRTKVPDEVA